MARLLNLLWLAAVVVAAKDKASGKSGKPAKPVTPATSETKDAVNVTSSPAQTVTLPTIGLFYETYALTREVLREVLPWDTFSTEPLKDALNTASGAANDAYEQVSTASTTYGPAVKKVVYDSLASGEVYFMEAKSFAHVLYHENVGPHLDPHVAVVQDAYDTYAREHVNVLHKVCSDSHPVLFKHATDAYVVTTESVGTVYREANDHIFRSIIPAVQIGAEKTFASMKYNTDFLFQPLKFKVGSKTVDFPHGAPDVAFAVWWIGSLLVLSCLVLKYTISFAWRSVARLFSVTKCLLSFVFFTSYFLIFTLIFGLIFFTLRLVTLNYLCKCCGLCAKRKAAAMKSDVPIQKKPSPDQKEGQSKKGPASPAAESKADSKAPTKKPVDSKAPQQKHGKKK
eukprot:GEMP01034325.1.p1 GENE.GEMP01034325.1~~GEMP01034325.1.p1  ORF type:complete len:398 (+),score=87.20 GEMP01034325.1:82-1275(+)